MLHASEDAAGIVAGVVKGFIFNRIKQLEPLFALSEHEVKVLDC